MLVIDTIEGSAVKFVTVDLPFEIPDSWMWVRGKNIFSIKTGKQDANHGCPNGNYPFYTCALVPILSNTYSFEGEALILPGDGANVGVAIYEQNKFEAYQRTYVIQGYGSFKINFQFLLLYFNSEWKKYNSDKQFGSAIPYIKLGNLEDFLVAIPPLNEQLRINSKLSNIDHLIKAYDKHEIELSTIENNFPEQLKKSILQYAIQGKLVPQDPNDEPASVLLERIKTEKEQLIKEGKIKRDKNESVIYQGDDKNYYEKIGKEVKDITDDLPFEIPNSWFFARMFSISSYGYTTNSRLPKIGDWLLELEDIKSGSMHIDNKKQVKADTNLNSKVCFEANMVLYSKLRPYLDKILISAESGVATSEIVPFYSYISSEYLVYVLRSPYFLDYVTNLMYGVKMPRLGTNDMQCFLVPFPNLKEQQKIVDKIKQVNLIIEILYR